MSRPITSSSAYVGRYADGSSWPWVAIAFLLVLALPLFFIRRR